MGHFSYSCALTGLPICGGDAVVFVPLCNHEYRKFLRDENSKEDVGATCFISNDGAKVFFKEATWPIFGEYDDYGGIENIVKDDNTKMIEEYYGMTVEDFCRYICCNRKRITDEYSECYQLDKKTIRYKEIIEMSGTWFRKEVYDKLVVNLPNNKYEKLELGHPEMLKALGFEFVKDENEGKTSKETKENRYHYIYQKGKLKINSDHTWINVKNNRGIYYLEDLKKYCEEHGESLDIDCVNYPSSVEQIYELKLPTAKIKLDKLRKETEEFNKIQEERKLIQEKIKCIFMKRSGTLETPQDIWSVEIDSESKLLPNELFPHIEKIADGRDYFDTTFYEVNGDIKKGLEKVFEMKPFDYSLYIHYYAHSLREWDLTIGDRYVNHLFLLNEYDHLSLGFFKLCKEKVLDNLMEKFLKSNIINWHNFVINMYSLGKYLAPVGTAPQDGDHVSVKRIYEKALEVINADLVKRHWEEDEE